MELLMIKAATDAAISLTLALSFGLALLIERFCRSAIFRLMLAGLARAGKHEL